MKIISTNYHLYEITFLGKGVIERDHGMKWVNGEPVADLLI